jgi:hypothetical protein
VEEEATDQRQEVDQGPATGGLAGEGPPDGNPRGRHIRHSSKDRCGARHGEGPTGGDVPCPPHGVLSTATAAGGTTAGLPGDAAHTQEERGGNSVSMGAGRGRRGLRSSRGVARRRASICAGSWLRARQGRVGEAAGGAGEVEALRAGWSGAAAALRSGWREEQRGSGPARREAAGGAGEVEALRAGRLQGARAWWRSGAAAALRACWSGGGSAPAGEERLQPCVPAGEERRRRLPLPRRRRLQGGKRL